MLYYGLNMTPTGLIFVDRRGSSGYAALGYNPTNVRGIVKVSLNNVPVYENLGFATNDFSSPDITYSGWTKDLSFQAENGVWKTEYKVLITGMPVISESLVYTLAHVSPEVFVNLSFDYVTARLTSEIEDKFEVSEAVVSKDVSHKIVAPDGAGWTWGGSNPAQITDELLRVIGGGGTPSTDIWSGIWQTTAAVELNCYYKPTGNYYYIIYSETVSGYDAINIAAGLNDSDLLDSLRVFTQRTMEAAGMTGSAYNQRNAERLKNKLSAITANWIDMITAYKYGQDWKTPCNTIKDILKTEGIFPTSSDDVPVEIKPFGTVTTTGGGSTFNFTYSANTPVGGNVQDLHIQDTGGHKYLWYNSGTWQNKGDLVGEQGADGLSGGYTLAYINNIPGSNPNTTGLQTQYTWTTPTGDLVYPDGSSLVLSGAWYLNADLVDGTLSIQVGGSTVVSFSYPLVLDSYYVYFDLRIVRLTEELADVLGTIRDDSNIYPIGGTKSIDWTDTVNVSFHYNNTEAISDGGIELQNLLIDLKLKK